MILLPPLRDGEFETQNGAYFGYRSRGFAIGYFGRVLDLPTCRLIGDHDIFVPMPFSAHVFPKFVPHVALRRVYQLNKAKQ